MCVKTHHQQQLSPGKFLLFIFSIANDRVRSTNFQQFSSSSVIIVAFVSVRSNLAISHRWSMTTVADLWPLLYIIHSIPDRLVKKILDDQPLLEAIGEIAHNVLYNGFVSNDLTTVEKLSLKRYRKRLIDLSNRKVSQTRKYSILKKHPKIVPLLVRTTQKFLNKLHHPVPVPVPVSP